jgi:hypothetical protein
MFGTRIGAVVLEGDDKFLEAIWRGSVNLLGTEGVKALLEGVKALLLWQWWWCPEMARKWTWWHRGYGYVLRAAAVKIQPSKRVSR